MSAPNFYLRNAKRYFVAKENDEEENHFWFIDTKDYLADIAASVGINPFPYEGTLKEVEQKANDNTQYYYASALHNCYEQTYTDKFGNVWTCYMYPCLRQGYYSGAVLDYYIELMTPDETYTLDNEDVFSSKYVGEFVKDYCTWDAQYGEDYTTEDKVAIAAQLASLIENAERKFEEFAEASGLDEYAKAWQASNGEAGYTNLSEVKRKAEKV